MANYRLRIGFPSGYQLTAVSGSYSLTGQTAVLSYAPSASGPTASSPTFTTYTAGSAGQAVLGWLPPTTTTNPLVPLASYPVTSFVIYYNTDESLCYLGAPGVTTISGISSASTSTTLSSIAAGTKYFSIAPVNSNGTGDQSPAVKVVIT